MPGSRRDSILAIGEPKRFLALEQKGTDEGGMRRRGRRWFCGAVLAALVLFGCRFDPRVTIGGQTCGNGVLDPGEACDGLVLNGQTCQSIGFAGGSLACRLDCGGFDTTNCSYSRCGNSIIEGTEECDLQNLDGKTCASLDGFVDGPLFCGAMCRFDTSHCKPATCGDGTLDAPAEECDGSDLGGMTCDSLNLGSGTLTCQTNCLELDTSGCAKQPICGNGVVEGNEECDEGSNNSNTNPDACRADCTLPWCGDGVADSGEACDTMDLNEKTCASFGMGGTGLACNRDCRGFDRSACLRPDGRPCTSGSECMGGVCFGESQTGYPRGFCVTDCHDNPTICAAGEVCVTFSGGGAACMVNCDSTNDCRTGYSCFESPDAQQFGRLCLPTCTADSQCPLSGSCNEWTGFCNDPESGRENGQPCDRDDQCKGSCAQFQNGKFCTSRCAPSSGICPGTDTCFQKAEWQTDYGDFGICLSS
ncbi:MAG: hypothetical protein J7M25_14035 [Deltaproteobacteria bacterium]|nr:hypothetical protein [Deltaproteobacteria bacterium]